MNNHLFIDIETIPAQRKDICDYVAASVKPPATMKLEATINKWNEESRPEAIQEAIYKTGLDGAFGQVCCIGVEGFGNTAVFFGLDEKANLKNFNQWLSDTVHHSDEMQTTIVGHNVAAFDLRFLLQRYIVNGIRPHMIIHRAAQAKPWEQEKVYDTMIQFAGVGSRISLEKLCLALSIDSPKSEIDGSKVWEYVQAGKIDEVAEYCMRDVAATRAVFERMTFAS